MRKYESGTGWCAWRWTRVEWLGVLYLVRLHLLKAPWCAAMLHWILAPDPHPDPHDHPVSFLSITVRGGYTEWTPAGLVRKRIRFKRATDVHRIVKVAPGTLTLVFNGPGVRTWGFWTRSGWVDWRTYRRRQEEDVT